MKNLAIVAALLASGVLTAPALAQTAAPPAGVVNTSNWMTQEKPGVWRAFKLKGLDVYNNGNQKIGDIEEIMIDSSGNAEAAVIGVGGFLGMGEHSVAVPFKDLQFVDKERHVMNAAPANSTTETTATTTTRAAPNGAEQYPDRAVLNMTKDQLKAAPQFHYAK